LPIYVYECLDCLEEWKENHLMCEEVNGCFWCQSDNIHRKPSNFSFDSTKEEKKSKVGDLTKDFIENSMKDLRDQKKELDKNR
jgi:hypothetical protein